MIGNGHAGFGRGTLEKGRKAPRPRPTSVYLGMKCVHDQRPCLQVSCVSHESLQIRQSQEVSQRTLNVVLISIGR